MVNRTTRYIISENDKSLRRKQVMNFGEIVKRAEETKDLTLDGLFELWKEAQEVEERWQETTVSGEDGEKFRKQFTKDGIINTDAYAKADCKVLVVLKEANFGNEKAKKEALGEEGDHRVWYNYFVNGDYSYESGRISFIDAKNKLDDADNASHQKELIGRMSFLLQGFSPTQKLTELNPSASQIQESLKETAVINLNKRGGGRSTNNGILRKYCKKYALFIRREIEIIKPDVVVWCAWKSTGYEKFVPENIPVINMYHTAHTRMSNKQPELLKACGNRTLNQVLEEFEAGATAGYMAYSRHVAKYMLVFRERVKKTFEKNKLKL